MIARLARLEGASLFFCALLEEAVDDRFGYRKAVLAGMLGIWNLKFEI